MFIRVAENPEDGFKRVRSIDRHSELLEIGRSNALKTSDFSIVVVFNAKGEKEWKGEYFLLRFSLILKDTDTCSLCLCA